MIIKQETVGKRTVEILYPAYNGLYCIETKEPAGGWCYPWEVRKDGTRVCEVRQANNRRTALEIFSEMVTREKLYA